MERAATSPDERVRIPASARDFEGFRRWSHSDRFPQRGRIDYLAGRIEVDMSPEELYTHNTVKVEIGTELHRLITKQNLGSVFIDRARIASPEAELSVEPDVVVILWGSLDAGRARNVPSRRRPDKTIELEGAPDLVVEVVSDGSVTKDRRRLPPLYAAAGVPELWLVDARDELQFEMHALEAGAYRELPRDPDGWALSPLLGLRLRLTRHRVRPDIWGYRLEQAPPHPAMGPR